MSFRDLLVGVASKFVHSPEGHALEVAAQHAVLSALSGLEHAAALRVLSYVRSKVAEGEGNPNLKDMASLLGEVLPAVLSASQSTAVSTRAEETAPAPESAPAPAPAKQPWVVHPAQ